MAKAKQMTIKVDGEKITIKSVQRTSMGNHCGWYVAINGERFFVNVLERRDAEDRAFSKWVKSGGIKRTFGRYDAPKPHTGEIEA